MIRTASHSHQHPRARSNEPIVIGLTGGIGSGKSTVAHEFERLGCGVLDFDMLAKRELEREDVIGELCSWWGNDIVDSDGVIDRKAIGAIVFSDPAQRTRLEGFIHPRVIKPKAELIAMAAAARGEGTPIAGVVLDAPLLLEAGLDRACDVVAFVDASEHARAERVQSSRGWTRSDFQLREEAQMPLDQKRARCRFVIHNSPNGEALSQQVGRVFAIMCSVSGSAAGASPSGL